MLRRDRTAAEYRTILLSNREEIERLTRLTEALLLLARTDSGRGLAKRTTLNLASLAADVVTRIEPVAQAREVTLQVESISKEVHVLGDPLALEQVIFNLVENAVHHSPAKETVEVRVGRDIHVWLKVTDHGCGIASEHLPRIFDRFYRVDSARNRAAGGAGLGLAIVRSLVQAHGGTVQVSSELGQGTVMTVHLPLLKE